MSSAFQVQIFVWFLTEVFLSVDIEEGNWLTLSDTDIKKPGKGFDAVVCLGNSFAHLPDPDGDFRNQRAAIGNFHKMLKPGGILIIDHRNYDFILDTGKAPQRNIYYNVRALSLLRTYCAVSKRSHTPWPRKAFAQLYSVSQKK